MRKFLLITIVVLTTILITATLYGSTIQYHSVQAVGVSVQEKVTNQTAHQKQKIQIERTIEKKPSLPASYYPRFVKYRVSLPLAAQDYYYGKHTNAKAAANELNTMPVLRPGDSISIITDGYVTFAPNTGYIKPGEKFFYASGACWSVSTLGYMMDEANLQFEKEFGIQLFVFENGDRYPHTKSYATYGPSNNGYGYTVAKTVYGASPDYSFTINPELLDDPRFENLEMKIVVESQVDHQSGYTGQAVSAHLLANVDF